MYICGRNAININTYLKMSRKYNIFIAGSVELKSERSRIEELANELNTLYEKRNIHLIVSSCEHFEDNQPAYNRHITHKADLVLLILDDKMNPSTEDELLLASKSFDKSGHPEVRVFLHDFEDVTADISRIQGVLKALGNKYYIKYKDINELATKARRRIEEYIEDSEKNRWQIQWKRMKQTVRSAAIYGLLFTLLCLGCLFLYNKLYQQPTIIFAGGGSVANFISAITKDTVNVRTYPNSIYINLASGNAWSLLAEEANKYTEKEEEKVTGNNPFISICLSADKLDSTFINEKTRPIFTKGRVVEYFLGRDSLAVYIKKELADSMGIADDTAIYYKKLSYIIKWVIENPDRARLFTTSENSGTMRIYQQNLAPEYQIELSKLLNDKKSYLFYDNSSSDRINTLDGNGRKLPYVILGSDYYFPKMLENEYQKYHVVDSNKMVAQKPMYIYFIAYKHGEHDCEIRKPIIEFLEAIQARKHIDDDLWNEISHGKIRPKGGEDILKLNKKDNQ